MDAGEPKTNGRYRLQKRIVIGMSLILAAALGPILVLVEEGSTTGGLLDILFGIGFHVLILEWCYIDSMEKARQITPARIWVLLFGVIALCIYFVRSRGVRGAAVAMVKLLALMGLEILVASFSALAAAEILGPP
jgi:hypothetical protein